MKEFPNANLLLIGQKGMTMKEDAMTYAEKCLGISPVEKHPDFLFITLPEKKKSIGVDDIYPLIEKGHDKPLIAEFSIAIINHFDKLTEQAQNKLLLLIEGNKFIQIIGISYGEGKILPTIMSRMYKLPYKPLTKEQFLATCGLDKADGTLMYYATGGVPGLLEECLSEKQMFSDLAAACRANRVKIFNILHLSKEKDKDAITNRPGLIPAVMRVMLYAFEEDMKEHWHDNVCYANRCSLIATAYNELMQKKGNYSFSKEDFFHLIVRCVE